MGIDLATVVVNIAYVSYIAAAVSRSVTWLRVFLTITSAIFVVFGILADIPSIVVWNVAFGGFNLWRLVSGQFRQRKLMLTDEERSLHHSRFGWASSDDFARLWHAGWPERYAAGDRIRHRKGVGDLVLVVEGRVEIRSEGRLIDSYGPRRLIRETTLDLTNPSAPVRVVAAEATRLRRWTPARLDEVERAAPGTTMALWSMLTEDRTPETLSVAGVTR